MIHALPAPMKECTHVQVTGRRDHPSSGMVLHYRFGTLDADGAFRPDPMLKEVQRTLNVDRANQVRERAKGRGRPITDGEQEYMWTDLLDHMDTNDLWTS